VILSLFGRFSEKPNRNSHFLFLLDYFNGSIASDLDVVVVGAYFAVSREDTRLQLN
jgi:hypothetical protein